MFYRASFSYAGNKNLDCFGFSFDNLDDNVNVTFSACNFKRLAERSDWFNFSLIRAIVGAITGSCAKWKAA